MFLLTTLMLRWNVCIFNDLYSYYEKTIDIMNILKRIDLINLIYDCKGPSLIWYKLNYNFSKPVEYVSSHGGSTNFTVCSLLHQLIFIMLGITQSHSIANLGVKQAPWFIYWIINVKYRGLGPKVNVIVEPMELLTRIRLLVIFAIPFSLYFYLCFYWW